MKVSLYEEEDTDTNAFEISGIVSNCLFLNLKLSYLLVTFIWLKDRDFSSSKQPRKSTCVSSFKKTNLDFGDFRGVKSIL